MSVIFKQKMSNGTVSSKSSSDGSGSDSSAQNVDSSIFTHLIPKEDRYQVRLHLDQNDAWERAAIKMGFTENDINVSLFFKFYVIFDRHQETFFLSFFAKL